MRRAVNRYTLRSDAIQGIVRDDAVSRAKNFDALTVEQPVVADDAKIRCRLDRPKRGMCRKAVVVAVRDVVVDQRVARRLRDVDAISAALPDGAAVNRNVFTRPDRDPERPAFLDHEVPDMDVVAKVDADWVRAGTDVVATHVLGALDREVPEDDIRAAARSRSPEQADTVVIIPG
jgi:hypothetical protein